MNSKQVAALMLLASLAAGSTTFAADKCDIVFGQQPESNVVSLLDFRAQRDAQRVAKSPDQNEDRQDLSNAADFAVAITHDISTLWWKSKTQAEIWIIVENIYRLIQFERDKKGFARNSLSANDLKDFEEAMAYIHDAIENRNLYGRIERFGQTLAPPPGTPFKTPLTGEHFDALEEIRKTVTETSDSLRRLSNTTPTMNPFDPFGVMNAWTSALTGASAEKPKPVVLARSLIAKATTFIEALLAANIPHLDTERVEMLVASIEKTLTESRQISEIQKDDDAQREFTRLKTLLARLQRNGRSPLQSVN